MTMAPPAKSVTFVAPDGKFIDTELDRLLREIHRDGPVLIMIHGRPTALVFRGLGGAVQVTEYVPDPLGLEAALRTREAQLMAQHPSNPVRSARVHRMTQAVGVAMTAAGHVTYGGLDAKCLRCGLVAPVDRRTFTVGFVPLCCPRIA